jgi:hypothetical protein
MRTQVNLQCAGQAGRGLYVCTVDAVEYTIVESRNGFKIKRGKNPRTKGSRNETNKGGKAEWEKAEKEKAEL